MDVQQQIVNYMEDHHYYDKAIGAGSYLEQQALRNTDCGYLTPGKTFQNAQWQIDGYTDFAIFDNINPDNRHDMIQAGTAFKLALRYQQGKMWGEIYERKFPVKRQQ